MPPCLRMRLAEHELRVGAMSDAELAKSLGSLLDFLREHLGLTGTKKGLAGFSVARLARILPV